MDLKQLGVLIKEQRERNGMSQRELANQSGMLQYQVSKLESGTYSEIQYQRLTIVLDKLGVSIDVTINSDEPVSNAIG